LVRRQSSPQINAIKASNMGIHYALLPNPVAEAARIMVASLLSIPIGVLSDVDSVDG
jgi:hypothetical protein